MSLRNHTRLSPVASSSTTSSSGSGGRHLSPSSSTSYSSLYTHSSCSLSSLHAMTLSTDSASSSRAPSPDQQLQHDNGSLDPCAPVAIGIRGLSPAAAGSSSGSAEGMSQRGPSAAATVQQPPTVPVSSHARAASSSAASRSSSLLEASSPPRFHVAADARSYNSQAFRPDSPDKDSTPSPSPPAPRGVAAKLKWGVLRAVRALAGPKAAVGKSGSKATVAIGGAGPCRFHFLSLLLALAYLLALFGSCFFFHSFRDSGAQSASIGRAQGVSPFGSLSLHLAPSAIYSPFLAAGAQNQLRIDLKSATCSLWMERLWPRNLWRSSLLINNHATGTQDDEDADAGWKGLIFAKAAPIPQQTMQQTSQPLRSYEPLPPHPQAQHDFLNQQMQQPSMQAPSYDPHAYDAHHYQQPPQQQQQAWAQPLHQQPPQQPYASAHDPHFDPHLSAPHLQQPQQTYNPQQQQQQQHPLHHDPYGYDDHHLDSHLFDSHYDAMHPYASQQHPQHAQHPQQSGQQHFDHYDHYADAAHPYDSHYGAQASAAPYGSAYGAPQQHQQQQAHPHSQREYDDYLHHHPELLHQHELELEMARYRLNPDLPPNLQHSSLGEVKDRLLEKAAEAVAAEAAKAADAKAAAAAAAASKETAASAAPPSDALASSTVGGAAPPEAAPSDSHAASAEELPVAPPSLVLKQHKADRDREKELMDQAAAAAAEAARAKEAAEALPDHAAPGSWIAAAIADAGKPTPPVVHAPPPSASMHSAPSHYSAFRLSPLLFYLGCSGFMLLLPELHWILFATNALAACAVVVSMARTEAQAASAAAAAQARSSSSSSSGAGKSEETTIGALVRSLLCKKKTSTRDARPSPSLARSSFLSLLRDSSLSRWCWVLALCCVAGVPAVLMERKYDEHAKRGKKGL